MNTDLLAIEVLTPEELSQRLGVSVEEVLRMEVAGDLFSYVRPDRGRNKLFPAYQLAPAIRPHLLGLAREALTPNGPLLDTFFNSRDPDLADLSVREILAGRSFRGAAVHPDAAWLLAQPWERRMEAVKGSLERLRAVTHDSL